MDGVRLGGGEDFPSSLEDFLFSGCGGFSFPGEIYYSVI